MQLHRPSRPVVTAELVTFVDEAASLDMQV